MLQDWQIAILRPAYQAKALFERVKALQGEPILTALYDIVPISIFEDTLNTWCQLMKQADFICITSANAIWYSPKKLISAIEKKSFIITMGKATSQALLETRMDLNINYTAPPGSTSETLLEQSFFQPQKIQGKEIILLTGIGGRTCLADELQGRKARLTWMKVYAMQQIVLDLSKQFLSWQTSERFCFIVTSSRMLAGLVQLSPEKVKSWLFTRPLIVVSERTYLQAKEWGFKHIFVAPNPHIEGIEYILQKMVFACDTLFKKEKEMRDEKNC